MKTMLWIAMMLFLLAVGFAAGVPYGKSVGFNEGSEWAIMQAGLFARESGVFMPVSYEEGEFRIVIRQPGDLHKKAWHLADRHYNEMKEVDKDATAESESEDVRQEADGVGPGISVLAWKESMKLERTVPASYALPQLPGQGPALLINLMADISEAPVKM